MQSIPVVIIGAGQAGLAMSHCLSARRVEHVVLERGRLAERWRSQRWDSMRLLTPNWMSRLPGWSYRGDDPDGFMTAAEFVRYLEAYAGFSAAPVRPGVSVLAVKRAPWGFKVETTRGAWAAEVVIIATGHCDIAAVPGFADELPPTVQQVTQSDYTSPDMLPPGGVLVVGASAAGVQLAEEIHRSGRPVSLSVGSHLRLPRSYRGRDIWAWLERAGLLDEPIGAMADPQAARNAPSFQLVGRPEAQTLDLGTLQGMGVRLLGRAVAAKGSVISLRDDLGATVEAAQRALEATLGHIDRAADAAGAPPHLGAARRIPLGVARPTSLDLAAEGIGSVIWATGFKRNYAWLQVPVLDAAGEIIHDGGVTPAPGLYVLGLRFMRRRRSNFIDGVGRDAADLTESVLDHLAWSGRAVA